jgi:predicted AlkP superfamily phosphohydrolase/phosphomutase
MKREKLVVIGLDGATFDIIKPLVERGELPTFEKLMKKGVYGNLKSTIPPVSAPAWVSFMTGKNPGKHGIFDFRNWNVKKYDESELVDSTKIDSLKIWDILNSFGKKTGVVNLPITYPPEKLDGFMISGMLTPSKDNFTYPPELKHELEDYIIDIESGGNFIPSFGKINKEKFFEELNEMADKRLKNVVKLLKKDWDLFIVVFRFLDAAQHIFWEDIIYLEKLYKKADHILKTILKKTRATIIVMSDHGFEAKSTKDVHINDWFRINGYLKTKKEVKTSRFDKKNVLKLLKSYGIIDAIWGLIPSKMKSKGIREYKNIDWSQSKAYFSPKHFAFPWVGIEINLKGKKEMGLVKPEDYEELREEIIHKLKQLKDPETKEKVIEKIYRKEEIYKGKHFPEASDIIIKFKRPYRGEKSIGNAGFITLSIDSNIKGEHEYNGIFLAFGRHVLKGKEIKKLEIIDITPTILHFFNLGKTKDMDGRVLKEIFRKDSEIFKNKIKPKKIIKINKEQKKIREVVKRLKLNSF